ncbi:unnamed protein product [Rotaria magnacalcarata]|uniref:Uncharacterized protein n=1 Tax=Rotaria magnacalcarata TaxID=392030 RepID=A0A816CIT6_9BILA|nr:unnamed protein product [Rotaria magnacalcarata]CAF1933803.1 unnamed protein product [Rotaria magnacalcarata]
MASKTAFTSSMSSSDVRRHHHHHHQSQISNISHSLSQSFSLDDASNLTESFILSTVPTNPLITIVYTNSSLLQANMESSRRNSTVSSVGGLRTADARKQIISGPCTFIRIVHSENQQLLLNSYASCRRLLDHMKVVVGMSQDETLDLMDSEGKLKELSMHFDDYATQFLTARSTYYVLKVEADIASGERRYTPSFNLDQIDQKLGTILTNSLNALNKSVKNPKRIAGPSRQNTSVPASSSTPQTKAKRASNRKQN